jgi:SpoVK/Ycf46/Vps4 family AAA+-type ATPase
VLVCGIPGTGKSLAAKQAAMASELDLPLLKMDTGSLMDSYIGASEGKMRAALKLAAAMSPCILWVDELEKGFAGAKKGGQDGDSGTFKRMFGTFLTWLQDNKSPVFIYATSNDVSEMPKEFLRNGRFDALYGTFMPTSSECIAVFRNTLTKMKERVDKAIEEGSGKKPLFDGDVIDDKLLGECVDLCIKNGRRKFITGADIYVIVNTAVNKLKEKNEQRTESISKIQFKNAVDTALNEVRTYGEGVSNLNNIAETYVSLLMDKFLAASSNNLIKEDALNFDVLEGETDYDDNDSNDNKDKKDIIDKSKLAVQDNEYDNLLLDIIVKRINRMGSKRRMKTANEN